MPSESSSLKPTVRWQSSSNQAESKSEEGGDANKIDAKKAVEVLESLGTNEGMLYYHTHGQGLLAGAPRCRQRGETRKVYFPGLTDLSLPLVLFHRFWFITGIALDYNIIGSAASADLDYNDLLLRQQIGRDITIDNSSLGDAFAFSPVSRMPRISARTASFSSSCGV